MQKITILLSLLLAALTAHAQFNSDYAIKLPGGGYAVSASSDGHTILTGAPRTFLGIGSAIVYHQQDGECPSVEAVLKPSDILSGARFGRSVALSADGNTAVVGGDSDDIGTGAVWVFRRTNGIWSQQAKIVAFDATGNAGQGFAVAVSGNGNTLVFGGPNDNPDSHYPYNGMGAIWIYNFKGGSWKPYKGKITTPGNFGYGLQGWSVAISENGQTIIAGEPVYRNGYAHIWELHNGEWAYATSFYSSSAVYQQIGWSVALNAEGDRAMAGAPKSDKREIQGSGLIFDRQASSGEWENTDVLIGTAGSGTDVRQGYSVAMSGDGATAILGAYAGKSTGAAWLFDSEGGSDWNQVGNPLTGLQAKGNSQQGYSVALSGDGNTLVVGGPFDDNGRGAIWLFPYSDLQPAEMSISSINPKSAKAHSKITISGNHLRSTLHVYFGGTEAESFNYIDDHTIEAWVGSGSSGEVKLVSACGEASYSGFTLTTDEPTAIAAAAETAKAPALYPNPVQDVLWIDLHSVPAEPVILTLTDAFGRQVMSKGLEGSTVCRQDMSGLTSGLYFLRICRQDGIWEVHNFIKQ
jgi:hypothetical protein